MYSQTAGGEVMMIGELGRRVVVRERGMEALGGVKQHALGYRL